MAEKMTEEEIRCLEMKKKLPSVCRNVNYTHQIHNLYKKMAQDMDKEWERTTFFYQKEIPFYEETVQENWMAVLLTDRKLNLLRKKKKDRSRKVLANVKFKSHLSQVAFLFLLFQAQPTEAQNY